MRFSAVEQLGLPVIWRQTIAGQLHRDGSRYLPILDLELQNGTHIGVIDRHHLIDQTLIGYTGIVQLVFLLSSIKVQPLPYQKKLIAEHTRSLSMAPTIYGQIIALPVYEHDQSFGYTRMYTELHLDIGIGIVGLRTTLTADNLEAVLGASALEVGMWLEVTRSRIDILGFERNSRND